MKVFISWSGGRSNKVARALSEWLPSVIQAIKPWMSEQIAKGVRWGPEMARALEETRFGIVCLTPENLTAPWILFETGALSKTIESTHVCPYLLGLKPADLQGPLAQFQAAKADATDTLELVKSINAAQGETLLPVKSIESAFKKWWPELEKELQEISKQSATTPDRKKRTEMNVLEEILDIVRQLRRDIPHQLPSFIQSAVDRARASSAPTILTMSEAKLGDLLEQAARDKRPNILDQPESENEAAAREERLKLLGQQLKSKKDKKDGED